MLLESCTGGHRASKSSRDLKIMGYNPRKRLEMADNTSFSDPSRVVYRGVTGHRNPPETRKSWVITHENGQNWPKSRLLPIPLESCTSGHRAVKSSRDSKIMGYNPRKRPEMDKNTTFADPARVVYTGHRASKSSQDSKIMGYNPRKRPEIAENTSFVDPAGVVYQIGRAHV